MILPEYKQLKNGSDIRGVAIEGVKGESVNLTNDIVINIARAFIFWLSIKLNKPSNQLKIAIGNDSRLSANSLKENLIFGIKEAGCEIFDCGLISTPAMFMTCVDTLFCDGSIQITASHLPFNRNGFKFFTKEGGLDSKDIEEILTNASQEKKVVSFVEGKIKQFEYIKIYSKLLCEKVIKETNRVLPLSGLKIVVDAGNGAGGFFANLVLKPLGANIEGSQFLEPDGNFPNHIPNPENEQAMKSISQCVIKNNADLGIIFDTDVDRAAIVDENGKEINKNKLIALISAIILEKNKGATIVTDSITSSGLNEFIEKNLGGKHHRFKRGYKNVINEAIRLNNIGVETPIAIETSGHCAFFENYFLDDGAYLIVKLLIALSMLREKGKTLSSLIIDLIEPLEAKEFRIKILTNDFKQYGQKVLNDLLIYCKNKDFSIEPNNYEGVKVNFNKENGDGWFLLRLSLHDPILPLNIESDSMGGVLIIVNLLKNFLNQYEYLDCNELTKYLL